MNSRRRMSALKTGRHIISYRFERRSLRDEPNVRFGSKADISDLIQSVRRRGRDESGKLIPIDLKVGDTVLFGKWSGTEVKIEGEDLLIMKESDIMGVIEGGRAAKKKAA